jgi:hypothetical protein
VNLLAPGVAIILLALAAAGVWYACQGVGWLLYQADAAYGEAGALVAFVLILAGLAVLVRAWRTL